MPSDALASKTVTIQPDVLAVLERATWQDDTLILPEGKLERPMYVAVNAALAAIGGAWNRKARGHVFPAGSDPQTRLETMLATGQAISARAAGFFATPPELAQRLVEQAGPEERHTVLEPSAGQGAIADAITRIVPPWHVTLVELLPENCRVLRDKGYEPIEGDFLQVDVPPVDRVVMNPPFEDKQDIKHVVRAYELLRPGGRLVSVMLGSIPWRTDKLTRDFREFAAGCGRIDANPLGSFTVAGTNVRTVTVILDKPGGDA